MPREVPGFVTAGDALADVQVKLALVAAYRFISQPLRMSTPRGGPKTATYRADNYNKLTAQLRDAIETVGGQL